MRGWMNAASYIERVEIGAVMRAGAVGPLLKLSAGENTGKLVLAAPGGHRPPI